MPYRLRNVILALQILATADVLVAQPREYGISQRSSSWETNLTQTDRTAGIDTGSITIVTLKCGNPKGVRIALWQNSGKGFSGSGTGQSGVATYDAEIRRMDGSTLDVHCVTTDGTTAKVKIGKHDFEVADCGLLLIDVAAEDPRVLHMKSKRNQLPKSLQPQDLVKYATANERISQFWHGHNPDAPQQADTRSEQQ